MRGTAGDMGWLALRALWPGLRARGRRYLRGLPALGLIVVLAGCLGETGGQGGFFAAKATDAARKPPLRQVALVSGKVLVVPPRGYCVDRRSLRRGLAGGFALIAACNSLTGDYSGADAEPVVMTVQVQPGLTRRDLPRAADLAAALAPARALREVDGDGLTLVQLDSGGDGGLPKGDPKHWRGAAMINGYLVGVALYAPKGNPLAGPRGERLIHALLENIMEASLRPVQPPS